MSEKIKLYRGVIKKEISKGYSWKSLFFGVFYPLFNGDTKGFFIQLPIALITCGFNWLITPFHYNENRLNRLLYNGWQIEEESK